VIGMMLRLWSEPGREDSNRCCTPDAMALARRVAARLDIPFYAIDAKEIFRSTVVQYFLDGYANGETPNPCLVCNRTIRWKYLLEHTLAMGADYMATGHYARLSPNPMQGSMDPGAGSIQLLRGVDRGKDQSYVLHILDQPQLKRALFPVGDFPKHEIRRMAEGFGLPTASRPDSQDLCFLAGEDYRHFIQRNAPESLQPGDIVDVNGKILGRHPGLSHYTIGQRKGLGLATPRPYYVIRKHAETNSLIVGLEEDLGQTELAVKEVNWISGQPPLGNFRAQVKTRYTAREAWAEVTPLEAGCALVRFDEPQRDITSGQSAVFYEANLVLGGGQII
jgi:tRNA-specific 2-thiouridylase